MGSSATPTRSDPLEWWGRRVFLLVVAVGVALALWGPAPERGLDADGVGGGIIAGGDPVAPGLAPGRARTASPQSIDPAARSAVRVRVSDGAGRPVPGAEILLVGRSGELIAKAVSDAEGGMAVLDDAVAGAALVVQHPGYERVVVERIPSGVSRDEIHVMLPDGGAISGWVRTVAGDLPRHGVWVVARRADEPRTSGASLAHVDPSWPRAQCESGGRFTVTGLRLGGVYDLIAGGLGWVADNRRGVSVGAEDVRLTLRALYGADVEFVLPTGEKVATSRDLSVLGSGMVVSPSSGASPLGTEAPGAFLAGVSVDRGRSSWRLLALSDVEVDAVGPFVVSGAIPGFSTTRLEIRLPRVKESLARAQVVLTPSPGVDGWHSLAFRIDMPYVAPDVDPSAVVGHLRLDGASGPPLGHLVREAQIAHRVEIDGIPAGRYAVRFVPQGWPTEEIESLPAVRFEVPGAGTPVSVPVPDTGGVRIRFRERRRASLYGNLRLRLVRDDRWARTTREIHPSNGADFVLHAVPEGDYEVELTGPASEALYRGAVRVVRGQVALLEPGGE